MPTANSKTTDKKKELNQELCTLTPVLFTQLVFELDNVEQYLPGGNAPLALRAMELVNHMNATVGLERLEQAIKHVVGDQAEQSEPNINHVDQLVGILYRSGDPKVVLRLGVVADAFVRKSVVKDSRDKNDQDEKKLRTIVVELATNASQQPSNFPLLAQFVVVLEVFLAGDPGLQSQLCDWFNSTYGRSLDRNAILGVLPKLPDLNHRVIWMEIVWDSDVGVEISSAVGFLRIGDQWHRISEPVKTANRREDVGQIISGYQLSQTDAYGEPNHVSVVCDFSELHEEWEIDQVRNEVHPFPITVRLNEDSSEERRCPEVIDEDDLSHDSDPERLSEHVQDRGVFVSSELDGSEQCPCDSVRLLLRIASLGIWTRSKPESLCNRIADAINGERFTDIPAKIHRRREFSLADDAVWRRTVLFFNPNVDRVHVDHIGYGSLPDLNTQL